MKVLIVGQARTGTTALYASLKAALSPDALCLFEPSHTETVGCAELQQAPHLLIKTLLDSRLHYPFHDYADHIPFDHLFLMVRDPRDRLVSALLFLLHWSAPRYPPLAVCNPVGFASVMRLLRQKEARPDSVPLWKLFERILAQRFGTNHDRLWLAAEQARLEAYLALHPTACLVRYEEFVVGHRAPVEHVLGFSLSPLGPPAKAHRAIWRRGGVGEWRQWFLPEDCTYFAPVMQPYLQRFYAEASWDVPKVQHIDSRTSSQYVEKWCRVTRFRSRSHATPA